MKQPQPSGHAVVTNGVTFTVDVENHLGPEVAARYPRMTRILLDFLEQRGLRGTFFVEDAVARHGRGLVREIAARGHELASHSHRHAPLAEELPAGFAAGMQDAKARLEDLGGAAVLGFRAPEFSLVPASRWVVAVLAQLGFVYSSSVVPGPALIGGYPGLPRAPFFWPEGLLEIPCPVGRLGRWMVPFQGGMYLRYLPGWRYRRLQRQLGEQANWTYCHPYDIDRQEKFSRLPGRGWLASAMLWCNRGVTLRRWEALARTPAPPFADRLDALAAGAVTLGLEPGQKTLRRPRGMGWTPEVDTGRQTG